MAELQLIQGGTMIVPQFVGQYVYLDFDGAETRYDGELLTIDQVNVADSGISRERIAAITAKLNEEYAAKGVIFIAERSGLPETAEYSTVYIGRTSAFAPYGSFAGVAETIDSGNQVKDDNAFVNLDAVSSDAEIVSVISHEVDHIVFGMTHGGSALAEYAAGTVAAGSSYSIGYGETLYDTVVNGTLKVLSGGAARNPVVNSGGSLVVSSGAIANAPVVNSGGHLRVSSGGSATAVTLYGGITASGLYSANFSHYGTTAASVSEIRDGAVGDISGVKTSGYFTVFGTAQDIVLSGVSRGTEMVDSAMMTLLSGVVAENTQVNHYGFLNVSSGGVANGTVVNGYWGYLNISSGGVANDTVLNGGDLKVSGGIANDTIVNSGGYLHVFSGGIANDTIVNSGGYLRVSSGGSAAAITLSSRGGISAGGLYSANFYHYGTTAASVSEIRDGAAGDISGVKTSGYFTVFGTAQDIVLNGASNGTTMIDSAIMTLLSGAVAENTKLYDYSYLNVSSGGVANGTVVNDHRGYLKISSGGVANDTVLNCGNLNVSGGTANGTVVNSGGYLHVFSGGIANDTIVNSGGYLRVSSGGSAAAITLSSRGGITASGLYSVNFYHYGTTAASVSEIRDGAVGDISGVKTHGYFTVFGTAQNIVLSGYSYGTGMVDSAMMTLLSGAVAENTKLYAYSYLYVSSGGVANGTAVNAYRGYLDISSGGVANDTVLNGGDLKVSGGTANGTVVNSGGDLHVFSGGVANNTVVNSGGRLRVSSGGSAAAITLSSRGGITASGLYSAEFSHYGTTAASVSEIRDGAVGDISGVKTSGYFTVFGTAQNIVLSGYSAGTAGLTGSAMMNLLSGAVAENTQVNYYGFLNVSSGGVASNAAINSYRGYLTISFGGVANDTVLNGGSGYVSSGGTANNTVVNSGGYLNISGSAQNVAVSSGGYLRLESGGWLGGKIELYSGASASVSAGGIIDFTVSELLPGGEEVLISNYNRFSGKGNAFYTMTVRDDQSAGKYTLATGAGDFSGTVTVRNTAGTVWNEALTVDDSFVNAAGFRYSMTLADDGVLALEIADVLAPVISCISGNAAEPTTADVTLTVSATDNAGVAGYAVTASDTAPADGWKAENTFTFSENGVYYFWVKDAAGNISSAEAVTVDKIDKRPLLTVPAESLKSSAGEIAWGSVAGAAEYIVEYSQNDFENVIRMKTGGNTLSTLNLPAGTWQWRVRCAESETWTQGGDITAQTQSAPAKYTAVADENSDVFFANAAGCWNEEFAAEHSGTFLTWSGTGERAAIQGKNRFGDILEGCEDANILYLTDAGNGDALFVDDIYTALPQDVAEQQTRLVRIDEIRAGAGDDLVDMTSARYEYSGGGMTIRGGAGDDTVWANQGNNLLFGDAGKDRLVGASGDDVIAGGTGDDSMHGGGGEDLFCFGGNWGCDTVEQLAGGSVTLWFESGSIANWDETALTYADGVNSVKVSGIAADCVTLLFGREAHSGSRDFAGLEALGAFADSASAEIFEKREQNNVIAVL